MKVILEATEATITETTETVAASPNLTTTMITAKTRLPHSKLTMGPPAPSEATRPLVEATRSPTIW